MINNNDYVYDIEIFSNYFLLCALNVHTNEKLSFEISPRKDERVALIEFLKSDIRLFGFNCINYDGKMLQKLLNLTHLKGKILVSTLKHHSDRLITDDIYSKFQKRFTLCPNVDLMLMHHFDNDARRASLKQLEFAFQMTNIQELPFEHNTILTESQMDLVSEYCWNDIEATLRLYNYSKEAITLRESLSKEYNVDMMSWNSPKIGEKSFAFKLSKEIGAHKLTKKTYRDTIHISDIIFPYVEFKEEGFQKLLTYFKSKVIKGTYKVFSEIPFEELTLIEGYYKLNKTKGVQKNLNILYKDIEFVFGTGGLHACTEPSIYESDEKYTIIDIDVSSYYPNLAIKNRLYPEHLGEEFCDIYENRYNERNQYSKGSIYNSSIKLELNGVYGKSNSEHSPFYDPKYTMAITINGQLLICMLAEALMNISTLLQANTDGVTVRLLKKDLPKVFDIINWWEELTKLKLEYVFYSKMIIKDVSNYMAISTDNKVKRKGAAFKTKTELELHENHSALIINEAISAYFIHSIDPIQFIMQDLESNELQNFFMRAKVQKGHKLVARDIEDTTLQRIVRYVVTNTGVSLIKIMPPLAKNPDKWRETEIESGWKTTVCNNLSQINTKELINNLNLEYYLEQIKKVIYAIERKNTGRSNKEDTCE
jgi:hypothetical protein